MPRVARRRLRRARRWGRCRSHHEGARRALRFAVDVDGRFRISRGSHPNERLRGDARGGDGSVRQELAAGIAVEATSILPS
jgi:hypothetical protein